MRLKVLGAAAPFACFLLFAAAPLRAQAPKPPPPPLSQAPLPAPGFMPRYEITKVVRAAGFEPLAPPLREGTTYVLRATDFRGILMRVVVDAHSGAIRAVNRIVPGPAYPGAVGMMPPPYYGAPVYGAPYGDSPYGGPPYAALPPDRSPDFADPEMAPGEESAAPTAPSVPPPLPPPAARIRAHPLISPPLPRPRPAALASRKAADDGASGAKSGAATAAPAAPAASVAPNKPATVPLND